ncbi:hypothetical protein [Corallococcus terminator]|uniref:Lipoprotein n=1 Tax=Corallococcus terminator TaxID=2316733 RepID=A0A3A8IY31_9BACT|nr:hypothetical protein [Corallococcus terminator]RKG83221.1 hypothetical protein D7V88_24325 [Corallococcus terminator]
MVLRALAFASVVSIFGLGCGGEPMPEGSEEISQPQQQSSELASSCEAIIGKFCRPDTFTGCTWSNGAEAECDCQYPPFNKWTCYQ